jgi:hypothetical protein
LTPEDDIECRRVVLGYALAKNEWDILKYILDRIRHNMHVSPARAALVEGLSEEDLRLRHISMFDSFIFPRDRKYGANPGGPTGISRDGPFSGVDPETIVSVAERNRNTIEVVTDWTYMSTEGKTMFVLKKKAGRWLIDSLKTSRNDGKWEPDLI